MLFPYELIRVEPEAAAAFVSRFGRTAGWRENVWRRHQYAANAAESGWASPIDQRRRVLHFRDQYALEGSRFVLRQVYLRVCWLLPEAEIHELTARIRQASRAWTSRPPGVSRPNIFTASFGDLMMHTAVTADPCQTLASAPRDGYQHLELIVCSANYPHCDRTAVEPSWIFGLGPRKRLTGVIPTVCTAADMLEYLPCQLELGCGPSTEAGVPPLHAMHAAYGLRGADGLFEFGATDQILRVLESPAAFYCQATQIHIAGLLAKPTPFYRAIQSAIARGTVLGPVFNNNFDGILEDTGVPTFSLRSRDRYGFYADYPIANGVRSLVVVGSHADRRGLQQQFVAAGLPVIYVDPEAYAGTEAYPLELPPFPSRHIRQTAAEFAAAALF